MRRRRTEFVGSFGILMVKENSFRIVYYFASLARVHELSFLTGFPTVGQVGEHENKSKEWEE